MQILLIETEPEGHYVNLYLKKIINEFLAKKVSLTLMTTRLVAFGKNNKFLLNNRIKKFYITEIKKSKRKNSILQLVYQIKYYFNIKNSFSLITKDKNFDIVYVNTLDHFDKALSLFGSPFKKTSFYGFYNHITFHLNRAKLSNFFFYIYEFLFIKILKLKDVKKIFILNNSIKQYLNRKNIPTYKLVKVNEAVDISSNSIDKNEINLFKKENSLENNDFIILIYGSIRKEKGIDYLFKCLSNYIFTKKIKIIIAGNCEEEILNKITNYKKKSGKFNFEIILFNYLINDKLQKIIFTLADLIWIGYEKYFFSSGVYYLAGFMGRPVIVNNKGFIYDLNKKYKIGVEADITNSKEVYKKINFIISNGSKYYKKSFKNFTKYNKKNIFEKQIVNEILSNRNKIKI